MQAVLECKRCGGRLQSTGEKIVYCEYCGSANVFTFVDRFALYNQANYLRQRNEFDRAINVYENILNEHPEDAEASFGIALCKYGIEYVDDPSSGMKIPTCHRTRIKLFSQDEDYKKAVQNADLEVASVYSKEAEQIDSILKKIQGLSFAQNKYDVFICYKESDKDGQRTETSVIAQDIYEQLSNRGYKVFFARKTLAGMIGSDYEPIIFSALYSAKVMLVIGSNPEEFQGIWVRNEWIRFMERISGGDECTLIPCYKGMSPYDLPSEMVSIQSLDISKIGFIQDITDALERLIKRDKPVKIVEAPVGNVDSLKRRAFLFLDQGDFAQSAQYFEKVLDLNPEDSESYWGKLLVEYRCSAEKQLENIMVPISGNKNYQMALRFANEEQAAKYKRYSDLIDEKIAEEIRRKEEAERLAKEEAREKERLLKQNRKKRRKRIIRISIAVAIFLVLYIFILDPTVVRIRTWFTAYVKDDPAAAADIMDSHDEYSWNPIRNLKIAPQQFVRDILPDGIDKKIDELDKYCIGYPKIEELYNSYRNRSDEKPSDHNDIIWVSLGCPAHRVTGANWLLFFNEDGNIDCILDGFSEGGYSTGLLYDSDDALARYKIDKSFAEKVKDHSGINEVVVYNYSGHGIIFYIDKKGNVYADSFGYANGKEVVYYGLEDVEKLQNIEDIKLYSDGIERTTNVLYALKSNGEVVKVVISSEMRLENDTGIKDAGVMWEDIRTDLRYIWNNMD
ncbi:MAG: TIR domain-containing protein [Lachnospiraceae bacterium]|nr:TIR domain-containing protein [Lachnospiraceae bacterium]